MPKQEQPPVWCESMEDARNRAVQQLESLAGPLGPHYTIHTGNLGYPPGLDMPDTAELGVEGRAPYRRLRLDFDEKKGPHYNVEFKGLSYAFCFPYNDHEGRGPDWHKVPEEDRAKVEEWMKRMGRRRGLR